MIEPTYRKFVLINRAVPGSGKTTVARCIREVLEARGVAASVHSTDDFFLTASGKYDFNPQYLGKYHQKCLIEFTAALAAHVPLVIADNTNLSPWQTAPYTNAARVHGYAVVLIDFAPRALEEHVRSQRITPEKPDAHEVPESSLREMIAEYYSNEKFLDRFCMPDPTKDFRKRWNEKSLMEEVTSELLSPYDADEVIRVTPNTYHAAQRELPARILSLMGL